MKGGLQWVVCPQDEKTLLPGEGEEGVQAEFKLASEWTRDQFDEFSPVACRHSKEILRNFSDPSKTAGSRVRVNFPSARIFEREYQETLSVPVRFLAVVTWTVRIDELEDRKVEIAEHEGRNQDVAVFVLFELNQTCGINRYTHLDGF